MIKELREKIISRKVSAVDVAKEYLAKAKALNKRYNSFISFTDDLALNAAKRVDENITKGESVGVLAGIPVAIKDNIVVKEYPATAGSRMLATYQGAYDADVVRFLSEEDALIIGKTNMDEFAMGSSSETSYFGAVKNNVADDLVPGGSSGGSAVAVATGQVVAALGSDTGGSIRQPASFTGVLGLKPTYGRVSRFGLIAMASSLDQIGPLTTCVEDAALLLEVISRPTQHDDTHAKKTFCLPALDRASTRGALKGLRIGVPKEYFGKGLDLAIGDAVKTALKKIEASGAALVSLSLPLIEYALPCYYILMPAEVSSNLARYDGLRYGAGVGEEAVYRSLEERYARVREKGFGREARRRIMLGTEILSAGYIDKYYLHAQRMRTRILGDFASAFSKVDIIACPVSPTFPFKAGERLDDPVSMYLADIYTVAVNLAGLPALSLPLQNLPLPAGFQLISPHFEEERLLTVAKAYEEIA